MNRVANHKGLDEYKKLNTVAHSIFLMAIIVEIVFAGVFMLGCQFFPAFVVNSEMALNATEIQEVLSISSKLLIVAAFFQISDGIQVVVLGALRGLQDVKVPMYFTFIAYWMIGFPISIYLGLYTNLKAEGVWIGLLAGLTAAAIMLYLRFRFLLKHHR